MSTETTHLAQFSGDVNQLLQTNYRGRVKPWLGVLSSVAALFQQLGPGEYSYDGLELKFAGEYTYSGGGMGTSGNLPASQYVDPVNLVSNAARVYVRRAVDNFIVAAGGGEASFEDFMDRVMRQGWEALERTDIRHIHGSSDATVCKVVSKTSDNEIVVDAGYGWEGADPTMFLEPGMHVTSLDAGSSFAELGTATIATIDRSVSGQPTQATITFTGDIDDAGTIADNDVLVFSTSSDDTDDWFETERGNAPLGLLDLVDPANDASSYLGVTESTHTRINPIRVTSSDWGEVEFMEFCEEIRSRSNAPVTPESHTFTMHPGVYIELAKTLVPFTQIEQKGRELEGGWTTVRVGGKDLIQDPYHIPDVVYALCYEDLYDIDLDGDPRIWDGDGSQFQRLINFDGKQWFIRHYHNRIMDRRNRSGALTSVTNPGANRFVPVPED